MKNIALHLIVVLLSCAPLAGAAEPAARKPNIVFFLADDLGQRDLGCYGSTFYETPNLDRLAKEGARFTDAYAACPVCSPTRASVMTGQWPQRTGITDFIGASAPDKWTRNTLLRPAPYSDRLRENTLVIFTSDNGGLSTSEGSPTSNHPVDQHGGYQSLPSFGTRGSGQAVQDALRVCPKHSLSRGGTASHREGGHRLPAGEKEVRLIQGYYENTNETHDRESFDLGPGHPRLGG